MQREYPDRPFVSVAVAVRDGDRLLITRRKNEPRRGRWALPGGVIEVGETVREAAVRELQEECGIEIQPLRVVDVADRVFRDEEGRVQYHYVLVVLLSKYLSGEVKSSSDIDAAEWVQEENLDGYDIPREVREVMLRVLGEPI